ncbi:MAG: hypothetical protein SF123_09955 [Chloroflexota bacterium]|nr:hypothetical protein [Chloroflexota bacterium]
MAQRKYALDFRREETAYVMERWLASQSCSLIGIGSVGKSNLLRHLATPEVQTHFMGKAVVDNFKAITIDPNMLGTLPVATVGDPGVRAWAGYELMMHRLFLAFYPFDMLTPDEMTHFYEAYQALQDGNNPLYAYMSLRYFELGLELFMRRGMRVIFMFDEFEELIRSMPVKFFHNLRGLRDSYKGQLAYLTFTRSPIKVLAQQHNIAQTDIEPFEELFTDNIYFVGPYNDLDSERMLKEVLQRTNKELPDYMISTLIYSTGGYAGLLRSALNVIDPQSHLPASNDLPQYLLGRLPIRSECKVIWMSLTASEQAVLKAVVRVQGYEKTPESELAVAQLMQKKLLRFDRASQQLDVHPPLLKLFILNRADEV